MKDMLWHAHENHYTVMAINVVNMGQVKAYAESAEEEASAVILDISPRQMKAHVYPYIVAPMVRNLVGTVRIPVALNVNHGVNMENIEMAIHYGYSSVMVDAFSCELRGNVRRVWAVAALTYGRGISVEAELGHVGVTVSTDGQNEDYYTSVVQTEEFVKRAGCDCLAAAIGTAHGSYPKNMVPKLDSERLRGLKKKLDIPLVLHGGSGAGEGDIEKAVLYGINKINVYTDFMDDTKASMLKTLEEQPDIQYMEMNEALEKSIRRFIKHFMRMIGSSGWYAFERDNGPELDWTGLTARLG